MNNIFIAIRRVSKFLYVLLKGTPYTTANFFDSWVGGGNPNLLSKFKITNEQIVYLPTGQSLPVSFQRYFDKRIDLMEECFTKFNAYNKDEMLVLTTIIHEQQVHVSLVDFASLSVFYEIFLEDIYGFEPLENCVIIDIGMNIGLATLYFASYGFAEKVYGYELIPTTAEIAQINKNNNPSLSSKIEIKSMGWAKESGFVNLNSLPPGSIFASIGNNKIEESDDRLTTGTMLKVIAADLALGQIISSHPSQSIIVKLDCEGSEYEIIDLLCERELLKNVQGFIIEWHDKGPKHLIAALHKNGFSVSYQNNKHYPETLGMVYAWNNSR